MRLVPCVLACLLLTGCPKGRNEGAPAKAVAPCKKFGDSCEYSPGKLGTCIAREGCTGSDCLFCQSQH